MSERFMVHPVWHIHAETRFCTERGCVPADDPAPAPVGLNPFEWDLNAYTEAVNRTPPRSTYLINIVAWARFCWWCTEHNIAAHFLPTRPATRTRASNGRDVVPATVTVELPREFVQQWADAHPRSNTMVAACRAALAGEA